MLSQDNSCEIAVKWMSRDLTDVNIGSGKVWVPLGFELLPGQM